MDDANTNKKSHPATHGGKWIRPDKRLAIYLRDDCSCVYCGATMEAGAELTLDHLTPYSLGGDNTEKNLVTACRRCNCRRQNASVTQFVETLRNEGVEVDGIRNRIRRNTRRKLRKYRKLAKQMIKNRNR